MFDKIINWISCHPRIHLFFSTFIFFGLVVGWIVFMLPFAIYDAWRKDFDPYFDGIREIWNSRNKGEMR